MGLSVSHLFFADDILVFFDENMDECQVFKRVLEIYSTTSGQIVNFNKSEVCFGRYVREMDKKRLAGLFDVRVVDNHGKY
jgi:hypothetical protein